MVKTGKTRKQGLERKQEYGKNAGRHDETRQTGNRQTENTGINTQGIMGQMSDTWTGGGYKYKTGETDQGVTVIAI